MSYQKSERSGEILIFVFGKLDLQLEELSSEMCKFFMGLLH